MWEMNLIIQSFFSIEFKIQLGGKNNGKIICVWDINEGAKSS
jgi:hypothetical protein